MSAIESVELVERWVFDDLSASTFNERERVLDDIDELEEQLTVWNRRLTKCADILSDTGDETVYRRRAGDLRSYFVRRGTTLYCIGVGKRKTTYDRDLTKIIDRASEQQPDA